MMITFKKNYEKGGTLSIKRADDSVTWHTLHQGFETHDLAHYAVEKALHFTNAFYGIVNAGANISEFAAPRAERPTHLLPENLPAEALQTEHIVNLLELEFYQQMEQAAFLNTISDILEKANLPFPIHLNETTLAEMRTTYVNLRQQWSVLKDGETLELDF
ncbi:MAG: hypothetical protein AB8G22_14005 [Saprospiraceae bacterium]